MTTVTERVIFTNADAKGRIGVCQQIAKPLLAYELAVGGEAGNLSCPKPLIN